MDMGVTAGGLQTAVGGTAPVRRRKTLTPAAPSATAIHAAVTDNGAQQTITTGSKLGLGAKLGRNTVRQAYLNNVLEGTPPTVATSATAVEGNTATLNSALPGAQPVDLYYDLG